MTKPKTDFGFSLENREGQELMVEITTSWPVTEAELCKFLGDYFRCLAD